MKKQTSSEATTEATVSAGSPASSAGSLPEFLTVRDMKEYLQMSQSAAYTLIHRSDFPSCRFGSSIRIPREPFLAWVEANTCIPDSLARYMGGR